MSHCVVTKLAVSKNKLSDIVRSIENNTIGNPIVYGSTVIMNINYYEDLTKVAQNKENNFWMNASCESMDFWDHPSNDVYEKLL